MTTFFAVIQSGNGYFIMNLAPDFSSMKIYNNGTTNIQE
jgi:hypothetical protein